MHPSPVVTQPNKNFEHAALVFALGGASEHAKALQLFDPLILFAMQGPSDPIRPAHPFVCVYVLQAE